MTHHDRGAQALAALLAALAGYVDAFGFLATKGFFVSFMSGNSTRLGIGLVEGAPAGALAAGLIGAFLSGVVVGALAGHVAGSRRRPLVIALVAALLAGGAALHASGSAGAAVALLAAAMGVENNVFERNGEVSLGVTYMTGSLVKLGQRIAAALLKTDRLGWLPYLGLWLSFVVGVVTGAATYPHLGLSGIWGAALVAALLALVTWGVDGRAVRDKMRAGQQEKGTAGR